MAFRCFQLILPLLAVACSQAGGGSDNVGVNGDSNASGIVGTWGRSYATVNATVDEYLAFGADGTIGRYAQSASTTTCRRGNYSFDVSSSTVTFAGSAQASTTYAVTFLEDKMRLKKDEGDTSIVEIYTRGPIPAELRLTCSD